MTELVPGVGSVWRSVRRSSLYPYKRTTVTVVMTTNSFTSDFFAGSVPAQVVCVGLDAQKQPGAYAYPLWMFFDIYEPDDKAARALYRTYRAELQQGEMENDYSNNFESRGLASQAGGPRAELGGAVHGSGGNLR